MPRRLFKGVNVSQGTEMEGVQRWLLSWRAQWPAKRLAIAVGAFVGGRSPDPITEAIQTLLAALGYAPGPADGQWGPVTREAICKFQRDSGLDVTGEATDSVRFVAWAELRRRSFPSPGGFDSPRRP